jgi:hypothetical protein
MPQIMSFALVGSSARINFTTYSNLIYAVQYNSNLTNGAWNTLTNVTGTGSTMTFTDSTVAGVSQRLYRVDLVVPAN